MVGLGGPGSHCLIAAVSPPIRPRTRRVNMQHVLQWFSWKERSDLSLDSAVPAAASRDENCEIRSSIGNFAIDISCILRFMGL